MLTLKEEMAVEVLKGNDAAACALADRLIAERAGIEEREAKTATRRGTHFHDGYEVYHWPEFRALMERMGLDYFAHTVSISFRIAAGECVVVEHRIAAEDQGETHGT